MPSAEARQGREDRVAEEKREFRGVTAKGHSGGSQSQIIGPSRLRKDSGLYFKCGRGSLEVLCIGLHCF